MQRRVLSFHTTTTTTTTTTSTGTRTNNRWYHSTSHRSKIPFYALIQPGEDDDNNNTNSSNNSDGTTTTSLEDIPHWTQRVTSKIIHREQRKVAQVDYDTYWKLKFQLQDDDYYRRYFNFGFVDRGSCTIQVPKQYPREPTLFLPRQWTPVPRPSPVIIATTTAASVSSTALTAAASSSSSAATNHSNTPHSTSMMNDDLVANETTDDDDYGVVTTTTVQRRRDDDGNDTVKLEQESILAPIVPQQRLRIVDVDCNLWHKDLLLLLLPKPPLSASGVGSKSSTTSVVTTTTTTTDDDDNNNAQRTVQTVPDCFQILHNDDLSPVVAMITPSSTIQEAAQGLELLQRIAVNGNDTVSIANNIRLRTTVGVHPYHVPDPFHAYHDDDDNEKQQDGMDNNINNNEEYAITDVASTMGRAKLLLDDARNRHWICAIGECGLDTTTGFPPIAYQIPYFTAQIELANTYQLPLFIHERNAHDALIELLDDYVDVDRIPNIVIHCFTGNVLHCDTYIQRGYYLSISGFVFREREASHVQFCLENNMIPLNRLMIETDAPYMGFSGCRELFIEKNRRAVNEPYLTSKERKVYSIKQNYPNPPSSIIMVLHQVLYHINLGRTGRNEALLSLQELADVTTQNANEFFGLGL